MLKTRPRRVLTHSITSQLYLKSIHIYTNKLPINTNKLNTTKAKMANSHTEPPSDLQNGQKYAINMSKNPNFPANTSGVCQHCCPQITTSNCVWLSCDDCTNPLKVLNTPTCCLVNLPNLFRVILLAAGVYALRAPPYTLLHIPHLYTSYKPYSSRLLPAKNATIPRQSSKKSDGTMSTQLGTNCGRPWGE